jgi:hypothetical protein
MVARAGVKQAIRAYVVICAAVFVVGAVAVALVFAASGTLLGLLGEQYGGLEVALRITFAASAMGAVTDAMSSLNQARGWLRGAWIQLPGMIVTLMLTVSLVNIGTTNGAAFMSAFLVVPGLITQSVQLAIGVRTHRRSMTPLKSAVEAV